LKLNEGVVYDLVERHLCDFGRAVLIIIYLYCDKTFTPFRVKVFLFNVIYFYLVYIQKGGNSK
ncbi:hypothetical protein COE09_32090, partial [Bacillus thuringiensis]